MKMYSEQELRNVLGKDLEVSEMVNKKLQKTYEQIRKEAALQKKSNNSHVRRKYVQIAAVVAVAVSTMTVCAASYLDWNNRLTEELQLDEEQQKMLEDTGMAAFSGASCTDAGVTVTALQSITDSHYTYLNFKVEGYSLSEGEEPSFEKIFVSVDGTTEFNWSGSFYSGIVMGADGKPVYADGSALQYDSEGAMIEKYQAEDGSLEYHMTLANSEEKGFFTEKPIHVEFENMGTTEKAQTRVDLNGTWALDWTLGGADMTQTYEMSETLGDSNATVKNIELSPISIQVTYDYARIEHTEAAENEDGFETEYTYYEEAPYPIGFKFKDGSVLFQIYGGPGFAGFVDDTSDTYIHGYAFDRVIDLEEVEAVLFVKEYPEGEETMTEENCYAVVLDR